MQKEYTPQQQGGHYIPANHLLIESLEQQKREQAVLLELSSIIAGAKSRQDLRTVINDQLPGLFGGRYYTLCLINEDGVTHSPFLYTAENSIPRRGETPIIVSSHPVSDGIFDRALASEEPLLIDLQTAMKANTVPKYIYRWFNAGIREMLLVKISGGGMPVGVLYLYGEKKGSFQAEKFRLFKCIADILGTGFRNILLNEAMEQQLREIRKYQGQESANTPGLQRNTQQHNSIPGVIGASPGIQNVLTVIERIAPSDSTVLLLGETGTGKEVIANAIHAASPRRHNRMIKVNCAALPHSLFESELFGHEKGAFTGALQRRIGKFEQAENSTLFLDEIGEMPQELQPKLLRFLENGTYYRVGETTERRSDVRLVAASNRNFSKEIEAGHFRSDLYYRVAVFTIELPSLRNRKEDIPLLAEYYLKQFTARINTRLTGITKEAMQALQQHHWPGNIRELKNVIERAVILEDTHELQRSSLPYELQHSAGTPAAADVLKLAYIEQQHILKVLQQVNGNKAEAARLLDIGLATLYRKLEEYGVR